MNRVYTYGGKESLVIKQDQLAEELQEVSIEGMSQASRQSDPSKVPYTKLKGGDDDWNKQRSTHPTVSLSHEFNKKFIEKAKSYAALPRSRQTFDARGPIHSYEHHGLDVDEDFRWDPSRPITAALQTLENV